MNLYANISQNLHALANKEKAFAMQRFFKTGNGEYGEGDQFLGVSVPQQRLLVKKYYAAATEKTILNLLNSALHEERLTGVLILVEKFKRAKGETEKSFWVNLYINNAIRINNWDLVDSSAHLILGKWLENKEKKILYQFAKADSLWKNRIAIVATLHLIRIQEFDDLLKLSKMLLSHPHDLIHKATGWMLREAWTRDPKLIEDFLCQHYPRLPRTLLRYAIEKMPEKKRKAFLKK